MLKIEDLKVGDKVFYQPVQYGERFENGIIKEIPTHTNTSVRVVYNCAGKWEDYKNYTSALTNLRDLKIGWKMCKEMYAELQKEWESIEFSSEDSDSIFNRQREIEKEMDDSGFALHPDTGKVISFDELSELE